MKDKNYKCTNDMITLGINQNKNPKQGDSWKHPGFPQQPDHPVVGINWLDAVRFCQWLTARERKAGRLLENQLYRLPSDEEWSRAAGLPKEIGETPRRRYANTGYNLYEGDIYRYSLMMREICPWGIYGHTNIPRGVANYAGCESGLAELDYFTFGSYEDGYPRTAPVGSFKANQYGLYDMGGNVWEWCSDYENGGSNGMGVLRGASWAAGPEEIYSSFRRFVDPQLRENDIGFRVVLFVGEVTGWNQGHSSRAVKSP
jgi:formylglycine-generating enzyme required for sulfatase activity